MTFKLEYYFIVLASNRPPLSISIAPKKKKKFKVRNDTYPSMEEGIFLTLLKNQEVVIMIKKNASFNLRSTNWAIYYQDEEY